MKGELSARLQTGYVPIHDYGATGDGRTLALVSREGSIDWWSPARFDAPSIFAALLDADVGGRWRLGARDPAMPPHQRYLSDTNVLETEHRTRRGRVTVHDFLALGTDAHASESVLVRRVAAIEGEVEMQSSFAPRFQYGRVAPRFSTTPAGLLASGCGEALLLRSAHRFAKGANGAREATFTMRAGEEASFVLQHTPFAAPVPFPDAAAPAADLERATVEAWRGWAAGTRFDGPDAPLVRRSALALKLLQHRANGAIIAAGTTSLPEAIGGMRNWDYRYTWLRDGAIAAKALHDVGHPEEALLFGQWMRTTIGDDPTQLRIMYTVSGSAELPERELPQLEGYRRSAPVRVGNAAAHQRQLDVYGEIVDFLASTSAQESWPLIRGLANDVVARWRDPDQGIWEMRCEPRHFVLSKSMAWVALDRALRVAHELGETPDPRWRGEARAIRAQVIERGYDAERRAFVQAYGFATLDASNLLLPLVGFLDARDPMMRATVDRTLEELTVDGLVYRYLGDDGLPGNEGAFAYCTFWLVEVLAMQGRVTEARAVFDRIAARATPLGLYAEEIDVATGEHLGNFPQAFPHAGLIQAARALAEAERSVLR